MSASRASDAGLAGALELPFCDTDAEVELAAGRSISDIFTDLGEATFREGERRVIARLLDQEPHVLATGGGAFMNPETRELIKSKAISVWLKADLEVLARRVSRKDAGPCWPARTRWRCCAARPRSAIQPIRRPT